MGDVGSDLSCVVAAPLHRVSLWLRPVVLTIPQYSPVYIDFDLNQRSYVAFLLSDSLIIVDQFAFSTAFSLVLLSVQCSSSLTL